MKRKIFIILLTIITASLISKGHAYSTIREEINHDQDSTIDDSIDLESDTNEERPLHFFSGCFQDEEDQQSEEDENQALE